LDSTGRLDLPLDFCADIDETHPEFLQGLMPSSRNQSRDPNILFDERHLDWRLQLLTLSFPNLEDLTQLLFGRAVGFFDHTFVSFHCAVMDGVRGPLAMLYNVSDTVTSACLII